MTIEFGDSSSHTFFLDYEQAAIKALRQVFLWSGIKEYSLHFRQAMYRRVQQEGLIFPACSAVFRKVV